MRSVFMNTVKCLKLNTLLKRNIRLDNKAFRRKPVRYYETKTGNYFIPADARDDVIAQCMIQGKVFEPEILDIAKRYAMNDSVVLDVGANFGQMSILFSHLVGAHGQVYSFEADDYVFQILQKNILANNCQNIRPFFGAVYNRTGEKLFYPEQDFTKFSSYGSFGLDPTAREGRIVETLTIDELGIHDHISFMKVDTQGSDLFVMQGARETIKEHQMPIVFEFEQQFQNRFGTSFQNYVDFISDISYQVAEVVNGINYVIVPKEARRTSVKATSRTDQKQDEIKKIHGGKLCKLLKSKEEMNQCTYYLHRNGYCSHDLACKDWDLANIIPEIDDGNFLDMGSSDSYILRNVLLKKVRGEKYGIDLREPNLPLAGVTYVRGNLMDTRLPDSYFRNITCLSVIEHEVDYSRLAKEASRLLVPGGKFFVTFDYWEPKIVSSVKLYNLAWQPLDRSLVKSFIDECRKDGLHLVDEMDWELGDAVIHDGCYSPVAGVSYTFGIVVFKKALG